MEPFKTHRGVLATLDAANVDTDQIIAKQFLKSIKRTGFGEHLFHDWRYTHDGSLHTGFSLNRPEFRGASILVARNNFGCGSSREHAVWAVHQYGFKAVIAPRKDQEGHRIPAFADIFRNNSAKNGLLTIELSEPEVEAIFRAVDRFPGLHATIDLAEQRVTLDLDEEISFHFEIDPAVKKRLLHGLDDIGISLKEEMKIADFERRHNVFLS
jgi:3-isopropylmalate/(R)-2-methylmalate dehydratase small subunit